MLIWPVASLGLVSSGAATDGVTLFFGKNWPPFSVHHCQFRSCHSGVTPLRVSPQTFSHLSDLVSPLHVVNSAHNFVFIRVYSPRENVTLGGPSPLVTPLRRKFICAHLVYVQGLRVMFVNEGHWVKVKVTGTKKGQKFL